MPGPEAFAVPVAVTVVAAAAVVAMAVAIVIVVALSTVVARCCSRGHCWSHVVVGVPIAVIAVATAVVATVLKPFMPFDGIVTGTNRLRLLASDQTP
jgi:hypothetical protein